jgi:hypothetical protein
MTRITDETKDPNADAVLSVPTPNGTGLWWSVESQPGKSGYSPPQAIFEMHLEDPSMCKQFQYSSPKIGIAVTAGIFKIDAEGLEDMPDWVVDEAKKSRTLALGILIQEKPVPVGTAKSCTPRKGCAKRPAKLPKAAASTKKPATLKKK